MNRSVQPVAPWREPSPGPWFVDDGDGWTVVRAENIGDLVEVIVAVIVGEQTEARTANARLIAAAPEMFEALRAIALGGLDDPAASVRAAESALAKAGGR